MTTKHCRAEIKERKIGAVCKHHTAKRATAGDQYRIVATGRDITSPADQLLGAVSRAHSARQQCHAVRVLSTTVGTATHTVFAVATELGGRRRSVARSAADGALLTRPVTARHLPPRALTGHTASGAGSPGHTASGPGGLGAEGCRIGPTERRPDRRTDSRQC